MVEKFDLHNSFLINMMYEKRDKWAQSFFRNHFMARMRSTQRCEGMNRFIKDSIRSGMKLLEVVLRMDRALMRLRNNQVRDDFKTMNSTPVLETHLKDLENHAASIYTYDMFKWVRKENQATLGQGPEYFEDGHRVYTMSTYKRPDFEHNVVYYHGKNTESATDPIMVCSYNLFQYRGVSCRHTFTVMKYKHINEIPKSLIVKRWSKSASDVCSIKYQEQDISKEALEVSRYGAVSAYCNRMCFYALKTKVGYNMLKREINRLTAIMEGLSRDCEQVQSIAIPKSKGCVLRDPITAMTKGREAKSDKKNEPSKRPITCNYCKGLGHNTQTCEDRKEKEAEKRGGKKAEKTSGEGSNTPWNATPAKRSIHCSRCKGAGHTYRTYKKGTSL
ncbi:protein FAR-RED ELONGATED HYPOCOTYL 3-like [Rosa rugosa]|uniref:protein FAR-RED ELONGATED HYPOCOTYL 3-like n=1 Tax=Rosa rugosa TaxID=74645 RepID=UPI002B409D4C|nr:protein FAR-RED ELONGATED HYPOCOTYL 3-like [Rosa rugosa]